jgi:hypothetical protein
VPRDPFSFFFQVPDLRCQNLTKIPQLWCSSCSSDVHHIFLPHKQPRFDHVIGLVGEFINYNRFPAKIHMMHEPHGLGPVISNLISRAHYTLYVIITSFPATHFGHVTSKMANCLLIISDRRCIRKVCFGPVSHIIMDQFGSE